MNNNINKYSLILIILLTSCSVNEFLDQPLKGSQKLEDFFKNPKNAESIVNGAYRYLSSNSWWELNFLRLINEMATDDQWGGNSAQARGDITSIAAYNVVVGSVYFQVFWNGNFQGITRANVGIENILTIKTLDEKLKKRYIAELKALRAWNYFQLVINFGGVPILKSYNELFSNDITSKKRATLVECYSYIEQELNEAIPDLPLKSEYEAKDKGRMTKGAAQSILAKVYLFQEKWELASRTAKTVIDSNEYQLEPKFEDIWKVTNHHGMESILEVDYIHNTSFSNIGGVFSVVSGSRGESFWGWGMPTSNLEKAFIDEGDVVRLRSTIIKHGDPVYGDPDVTSFDAKPSENKSGRVNRKFYVPKGQRVEEFRAGTTNLPMIHIRLADILLVHAEASFFNNQEEEAKSSLKKVRDRVNLTTDMTLTSDALRDAIWKERRLELALEQHRLYDIRRQKVNGVARIAQIMGPNGTFIQYNKNSNDSFESNNTSTEPQDSGTLFDVNKHLVWPIPPAEIQLSLNNIIQNPGYQ